MKRLRLIPRLHLLVAIVLCLTASVVWARSGSGEHYNSGRSSSSSSSGSDDGGLIFELVWLLLRLVIEYPAVGVPVLLIVLVGGVIYFGMNQYQNSGASTRQALDEAAAEQNTRVTAGSVAGWVNALKLKDPKFELIGFLDHTRGLFMRLQQAWLHQNLEPMRRFVSDATFQRLSVQLRILESQGIRDAMTDIQVLDLQLIALNQNELFDSVQVKILAQARDTDVAASASYEQATAAAKNAALTRFTEVWSFVRRPGAVTNSHLTDSKCPNCGAPFEGGATNQCTYCKAIVNSGLHDWVLTEVTQASEFENGYPVGGLIEMRQKDPEVSTEAIEDRASLVFWKWVEAQVLQKPQALAKVAMPALAESIAADIQALKSAGRRKVYLDCAVGAVNTHSFQASDGDDVVAVELRWSARTGIQQGSQPLGTLPSIPNRWVFSLRRKAGAQTPAAHGVSTNRCPNCSAPLSDNGSVTCEYCGTALASGDRDWVLESITPWESWNGARRALPTAQRKKTQIDAVVDPQERERLLYMMAAMAMADGRVDARERKLLNLYAQRWQIDAAKVEQVFNAGPQVFERLLPKASPDATRFMQQLVDMALVDGAIDRTEKKMLSMAAEHLGVVEQLPELIRAARQA